MESAAGVAVAQKNSVPCIVIKGISDPKEHSGNDASFALAAQKSAEATCAFVSLEREEE